MFLDTPKSTMLRCIQTLALWVEECQPQVDA